VGTAAVGDGPLQLVVTPDGNTVLVAIQGTEEAPGSTLAVVEAEGMTQVASIETGAGAHGVAVEPSGRYAYVTNLYGNTLAVVDLVALETVARVPTGFAPNGVSFSALPPGEGPPEVPLPLEEHDDSEAEGHEGESDAHGAEH
jgi:YVTN family beta-propeller protein